MPASRRSFRFTRRREKLVRAFVDQLPGLYRDGVLTRRALAEAHRQLRQDRPTLDEKREALAHDIARAERALQRDDAAFEAGMLDSRLEILPTCRVVTPEVRALPSSVEAAGIEPAQRSPRSKGRRGSSDIAPSTSAVSSSGHGNPAFPGAKRAESDCRANEISSEKRGSAMVRPVYLRNLTARQLGGGELSGPVGRRTAKAESKELTEDDRAVSLLALEQDRPPAGRG